MPWLFAPLWQAQDKGGQAFTAKVYRAAPCPCGSAPGAPANINCQACGGNGWLYPAAPIETLVLVSDVEQHTDLVQAGLMTYGDLVLSTNPGQIHLDDYDLVILPWDIGVPAQGQVIVRGTGATDQAWYRMENVEGAWTVNPMTGVSTPYLVGEDFTYSSRTITWIGSQPAAGVNYTIRYSGRFEWVAFSPPSPRVAFGQDLGQRVVLRKRHIVLPNAPALVES